MLCKLIGQNCYARKFAIYYKDSAGGMKNVASRLAALCQDAAYLMQR